ncbi:endolytic transglycosylase MltG [Alkanindiges sp. WGS2144]|uniref:endolytic transglycosylase MltG n=1 Tax=Alkanindiges sp. WGS2144 TaxID=3366808 RepID=UPI0037510076
MAKRPAKTKKSRNKTAVYGRNMLQQPATKGLIALLIAGLIVLTLLVWQGLWRVLPIKGNSQMLNIKQGQTYSGLIAELNRKGQLRLPVIVKIYQRLFIHNTLKAGVYEVKKGTTVQQLLHMLSSGELAQMNRILVVEGTTFAQLKARLDNDPDVSHTLIGLNNEQLLKRLDIDQLHPEGWFAPNTYYFAKGESDAAILKHLYKAQKKIMDDAWQQRAPGLPYKNPYEALIMASIVEKETGIASERKQVAGVFVRRLQLGMRLQTDPTVIYGMGESYQGNIRRQDLLNPTPYNTYVINGLPPTPIALPGKASIEAALHPAEGKSLYFVATGTGGHIFSDNLEQHNRAVASYLKVLRQKRQAEAGTSGVMP